MEREQGRTESAGGKDGPRRRRQKRDGGEDKRSGGGRDGLGGGGMEGKVQGRRERNTAGDGARGTNEERVGRGEKRGKEVGWGWRGRWEKRERWGWRGRGEGAVSLSRRCWLLASSGRSVHPTSFQLRGKPLTELTLLQSQI